MRLWLNEKEVIFPSSLSEITLGQKIDFQNQYGLKLQEMEAEIHNIPDELKESSISILELETMLCTFAFFTGCTVEALEEYENLDQIAAIYHSSIEVLTKDEATIKPEEEFLFKGEFWQISPPVKNADGVMFADIQNAKNTILNLHEVVKNKWENLLPICATYFRKVDEKFIPEFIEEGSERMELMKELPLDIVLQVILFFKNTFDITLNHFTVNN